MRDEIESTVKAASTTLRQFPKGPNGMTPDSVKATPEFQAAKKAYAVAFQRLREFNSRAKPEAK